MKDDRARRAASSAERLTPFGTIIRELRLAKGWSQVKLAEQAQVSAGYIGLIETGERGSRPSYDVTKRLAVGLATSVMDTERLMRAAGHLRENESLLRGSEKWNVQTAIASDPILDDRAKDLLLGVYEALVRSALAEEGKRVRRRDS